MAGSTTKKIVVRRFDRESLHGFVNPQNYQQSTGIELLKPDGDVVTVGYEEIKWVRFVRDFESARDLPESRLFQTRPKLEGLWVRMQFRDGELMDGVLPNNLLQLDRQGFTVTPPEAYSNHQRVFVPRQALQSIQILGVIGSPLRRQSRKAAVVQPGLFEESG